jgi:periplasmic protein TonB
LALSDIKVLRDIGFGTGQELIRVLKLSPKWKPGKQNNKQVRALYSLVVPVQQ